MLISIEWLDEMKGNLAKEYRDYEENRFSSTHVFNRYINDADYKRLRLTFVKVYKENESIQKFNELINNRNVKEFCEILSHGVGYDNFSGSNEIYEKCNLVCNLIEEDSYEVTITKIETYIPEKLTIDYIIKSLDNCDRRIRNGDYDAAVADAKTLLEAVFKELLTIYGVEYESSKPTFPTLKKEVLHRLNIKTDSNYDQTLKKIVSGLNTIIDSISEIRNSGSNSHLPKVDIPKHHAILAVNAAKSIVSFLFQSYEYQQIKQLESKV